MASATRTMVAPTTSRGTNKVVIERITQEKKKLRSVISFHTQPPKGYTFIPAGNPELTQALKDVAREWGHEVFAVTTTPHQKGPELSKEVHRIGFHFPSNVVAEICNKYGITLTKAGTVVGEEYEQSVSRLRRRGKKESVDDSDQVTINTKAKDAIQDLFPNIPERDLFLIIKTAFQKGQKKVGTANELSLVRRAQLSVVAHIRHIYTEYDRLLRKVGYHEARSRVEAATLKKLVEWRGDDESGKKVFEDVMKEVIVLPDDEGSDDDSEAAEYLETQNVQHSFERPQVLTRAVSPRDLEYPELLDNDGFQYVPQVPSRKRDTARDHTDEVQYRHDAWERARREFRENPVALKPIIDFDEWADNHPDHENLYLRDQFSYRKAPSVPTGVYLYRDPSTSISQTQDRTFSKLVRGEDGHLYERLVSYSVPDEATVPRMRRTPPPRDFPSNLTSHRHHPVPSENGPSQRLQGESPLLRNGDHTIVQSIEGPPLSPNSLRRLQDGEHARSMGELQILSPSHPAVRYPINRANGDTLQLPRKRKLDDYDIGEGIPRPPPGEMRAPARANGFSRQPISAYRVHDSPPSAVPEGRHHQDPVARVHLTRDHVSTPIQFSDLQRTAYHRASPPRYQAVHHARDFPSNRPVVVDHSLEPQETWLESSPLSHVPNLVPRYHIAERRAVRDEGATSVRRPAVLPSANNISRSNGTGEHQLENFRMGSRMSTAQPLEITEIHPEERVVYSTRGEPQMFPGDSRDRVRLSDSFISRAQSPLHSRQLPLPSYRSYEELRPERQLVLRDEPPRHTDYNIRRAMVNERYDPMPGSL